MRKQLSFIAIAFFLVTALFAAQIYGAASKTDVTIEQIKSLFEMKQYTSAEQAEKGFYKVFSKGDNVCEVTKYLDGYAKKKTDKPFEFMNMTFWGVLKNQFPNATPGHAEDGYVVWVEREHQNIDAWRIHIRHTACKLIDARFRLSYRDENFAKRGVPFRFIDFYDGVAIENFNALKKSLVSLTQENSDYSDFDQSLQDAGARYIGLYSERSNEYGGKTHYYEFLPDFIKVSGARMGDVIVFLNSDGEVVKVSPHWPSFVSP